MIHIAVSIDFTKSSDVYQIYLSTLMVSIAENTNSKITAHIFYIGDLENAFIIHLREILSKYDFDIKYHFVNIDDEFIRMKNINMWSPVIVNKFYFPNILKDCSKVIFFDLDIIVKRDISLLWNVDLKDNYIAGVQYVDTDSINREYNSYEKNHSLASRVNGGMIIMDLEKIRKRYDLLSEAKKFIRKYPDVQGVDEIVFNDLFFESTLLLPAIYQHFLGMDDKLFDEEDMDVQDNTICMHYAFKSKPFKYINGTPDYHFWKYFYLAYGFKKTDDYMRRYFKNIGTLKIELNNRTKYIREFYECIINKKIYMFGTGVFAKKLFCYLKSKNINIYGMIDNDKTKRGCIFYDCIIELPEEIKDGFMDKVILIAINNDLNCSLVKKQLHSYGLLEGINYFDSSKIYEDIRKYETENVL